MHPKLFEIPGTGITIYTYGLCIVVGFSLGIWIAGRRGKPLGLNADMIANVGIVAVIFGVLGSKINYLLQYSHEIAEPGKADIFRVGDGGFSVFGAVIFAPIPYLIWWWRAKEKLNWRSRQGAVVIGLTLLLAFVGARLFYCWQHDDVYSWKGLREWQSGHVWYGGMVGGITGGLLFMILKKQPLALHCDLLAPSLMLGLGFGRIGCFFSGCCYGSATRSFLGIRFPKGSTPWEDQSRAHLIPSNATHSLALHPAQLYETAACVALFFALSWYWKKLRRHDGETILLMCVLYGIWRFAVEFLRSDPGRDKFGLVGFTYSQTLSLIAIVVGGAWFAWLRTRPAPAPQPGV